MLLNPSVHEIYRDALNEDYLLSSTGALLAYSGKNTGRCPKDKRIVLDDNTRDIDWGKVNKPISKELFNYYLCSSRRLLESTKNRVYQINSKVGWDTKYQLKVRVYTTNPYHALFVSNMFIKTDKYNHDEPDFTIYDTGFCKLNEISVPEHIKKDDELDENLIAFDFTNMKMVIFGTEYAGEIKKGVLTMIMYTAPKINNLPLHSSCNYLSDQGVTLFFGLSGTGKTSLSTEKHRQLIGDDEHVWTDTGVYNVEGGNYAKCIDLNPKSEPEIFNAIKYGSVLENVVTSNDNNYVVDYKSKRITENTRCAYPLEYISNALIPATIDQHPKNIIFLSCDGFGMLPPVTKLNYDQAIYFFIAGYTSKMPSTEVGIATPQSTFSSCFGAPFLVWHPKVYGKLLKERLETHKPNVWLINTGWIEGGYGVGRRIPIYYSRSIIDAIHNDEFDEKDFDNYPFFNVKIPTKCREIPSDILNPLANDKLKLSDLKQFENDFRTYCKNNFDLEIE